MKPTMLEMYRAARLRGVPIISVSTPDQPATISALRGVENGKGDRVPLLCWDVVTGMRPLNGAGEVALLRMVGIDPSTYNAENEDAVLQFQNKVRQATLEPDAALVAAKRLPGFDEASGALGSALFIMNAHAVLEKDFPTHVAVRQAMANLRDVFKSSNRMLVLLGPDVVLPSEIANDVIPLREEYPDAARLAEIVIEQHKGAGLPEPNAETLAKAVDALRGIAAFPAEQITAMSLKKAGIDIDALRERKRVELEKHRGITVDRGSVTMKDVGGKEQIKKLLRGVFTGRSRPGLVIRLDEMEKSLAGAGPSSGDGNVSSDQHGVLLRVMEDLGWTGLILVSPPGVGKTHLSKAISGEYDVMSAAADLGGTKDKWVGSSEQYIRGMFRAFEAAAGPGGAFLIGTCNRLEAISPELRRRFRLGIWYDDLPNAEEREQIWGIQLKAYDLPLDSKRPCDAGWTGADIRNCCDVAWRLNVSLVDAAEFLVPVSKSDPGSIEKLRATAKGAFLSTAYSGPYKGPDAYAKSEAKAVGRRVSLEN